MKPIFLNNNTANERRTGKELARRSMVLPVTSAVTGKINEPILAFGRPNKKLVKNEDKI